LGLLTLSMLGCASPALTVQESQFQPGQQVVCRYVVPVGSHLKERVCETVAQNKEESDQAKRVLEEAQLRRATDQALQRAGGRRSEGP
jgi:hypothetical protein